MFDINELMILKNPNDDERKDYRLHQLREFLVEHPEIVVVSYFNTDYTHWLNFKITWEADWAIVNMEDNKVYGWFRDLELFGEKDLNNILTTLFHSQKITIDWVEVFVSTSFSKELNTIASMINSKSNNINDKINLLSAIKQKNIKSAPINKALNTLDKVYTTILNQSI